VGEARQPARYLAELGIWPPSPVRSDRTHRRGAPRRANAFVDARYPSAVTSGAVTAPVLSVGKPGRRDPAVACQQPPVVRSAQFGELAGEHTAHATRLPPPWRSDHAGRRSSLTKGIARSAGIT